MHNVAEKRKVKRSVYPPDYYGGSYDYGEYSYRNGSGSADRGYGGYKRKPAGKKPASKNQPNRKKAPVKNSSHKSDYTRKKMTRDTADYGYYRIPEQEMRSMRREPSGGFRNFSAPYAGRGQMSYDDFVRNREFFGGEDEAYTVHHQHRRTGGTVKNKSQQGKNKPSDEKNNKKNVKKASAEKKKNSSSVKGGKNVNQENGAEKKNKNQKRSKEIMNERARRRKIKRHAGRAPKTMTPRKRKIKRFLTAFSIFLVIAVISVMLSLTVFFKTEKIIVTGETRYSHDEIISVSQIETGENIFLCDKSTASKKIVDAFPFVAEANVSFVIPNAITIEIVEEVPSYVVGYSDGYYIIGENGRILEKTAENYDNLPVVQGTEMTTNVIGEYADFTDENITSILSQLVNVLEAYEFDNVTVIDISDTAKIKFVYDDRIVVVIGYPEDISYKVKTAQTIINEKLDPNNTGLIKGTLDVSMCNEKPRKSYFNENEVYVPENQQKETSPSAEAEASQETQETAASEETTEETAQETQEQEEVQEESEENLQESSETSEEAAA